MNSSIQQSENRAVFSNPFDHKNKLLFHGAHVNSVINGSRPFPIHLEIDLTNICNHACNFCNMADTLASDSSLINTDVLLTRLEEARNMGAKSVSFTGGGEPSMHPDFIKISESLLEMGYDLGIVTNGSLLIKEKARVVGERYKWVRISLGGPNQEIYSKIQGKDDFSRVLENIHSIKPRGSTSGVDLGLKVMLIPANINHLNDLIDALKSKLLDGSQISYIQLVPDEYTSDNGEFIQSDKVRNALEDFRANLATIGIPLRSSYFTVVTADRDLDLSPTCYAHFFQMIITATGTVTFCKNTRSTPSLHVGNIYDNTFEEIWNSDRLKKLESCINASNCNTFCRSLSLINLVHSIKNPPAGYSSNFF